MSQVLGVSMCSACWGGTRVEPAYLILADGLVLLEQLKHGTGRMLEVGLQEPREQADGSCSTDTQTDAHTGNDTHT